MNTIQEITPIDVVEIEPSLVGDALKTLLELTQAADGEIYTDAAECQASVNRLQDAIQQAYKVLAQIKLAVESGTDNRPDEILANRILDEAEEAFAVRSMAEERAMEGEAGSKSRYPKPVSVQDYLFWIEDEARYQENTNPVPVDKQSEQRIYTAALTELAQELRRLGFTPSPPDRKILTEAGGSVR